MGNGSGGGADVDKLRSICRSSRQRLGSVLGGGGLLLSC